MEQPAASGGEKVHEEHLQEIDLDTGAEQMTLPVPKATLTSVSSEQVAQAKSGMNQTASFEQKRCQRRRDASSEVVQQPLFSPSDQVYLWGP